MSKPEYPSTYLKENEELVAAVRRSGWTMVPGLLGSGLLLLLNFFLIAWWFRWQEWGIVVFVLILMAVLVWATRIIYSWVKNILIITDQRIIDIDQRGFLSHSVAEAAYDKIQDVRYTIKGLWSTLFRFGSIEIQTAGNNNNLELHGLRDPIKIQGLITEVQQRAKTTNHETLTANDLIDVVNRLKSELGDDEFKKMLNRKPAHKDDRH